MADLILTADTGRELGSRSARRLRRDGKVPAVVYGLEADPVAVAVDYRELRSVLNTDQGLNAVITLDVNGDQSPVLAKDLQRDLIRRQVTHVDFIRVDLNVETSADVPIHLIGEAEEVDREGGMVEQILNSITVFAKPADLPAMIEVDISGMTMDRNLLVSDLDLGAGVRIEVDDEEPVAASQITRAAMEPEEGEEGVEGVEGVEGEEGDTGDGDEGSSDED
ncbi:MAG: 50S ribosomal protein L25 [Actinomycetia bacterium]|nr:50S ribosomal protein L25 [Actinomycetes bacterium]